MSNQIFIGTFHKTGSVWMFNTFRELAKSSTAYIFYNVSKHHAGWKDLHELNKQYREKLCDLAVLEKSGVFFDTHAYVPDAIIKENFRGFCVVRDPRDVLLSAINYHGKSDEKWLHRKKDHFEGRSYSEVFKSLNSFEEKLEFEMNNSAGKVIHRMAEFARNRHSLELVKYEDLISDRDMSFWTDLMRRIGMAEQDVDLARDAFWNNSLFGNESLKKREHVTDGTKGQWKHKLSTAQLAIIHDRFGDEIDSLQYER